MTDRKKVFLLIGGLFGLLILFYSRILFTDKIIRAPDIINEFYWAIKDIGSLSFWQLFPHGLHASWSPYVNSGYSVEGGDVSLSFLLWKNLIFWAIPAPASVAWFIVIHLFFGAAGTYLCCRAVGASRLASFVGGAIFALAPEIASLINAGHVMKIATISYAPWAFYFLERGFQTRRLFFFLTTALVLAFQFFNTHWQIAFYTCLCIGAYGVLRSLGILWKAEDKKALLPRLLGLNLALLVFFLTTVSISLLPLANWSKETNRGTASTSASQSGVGTAASGGMSVDEAMSWSMPPEEVTTFVIPGFFGLSRQEGGENPTNINSYYWGRMVFTQTTDYMGLLPWLLLPLPFIFRRDRYTWLPFTGIVGGLLFSFGKYTPFYWLLYRFFPGIGQFRVPKMMMFIPVLGLAVLAARGLDLLRDEEVRKTKAYSRYLLGMAALPVALLALFGIETLGAETWVNRFAEMFSEPTRYEQGSFLVGQRWGNLLGETLIAAGLSALYAAVFFLTKKGRLAKAVPWLLLLVFIGDTWRINSKFLFTVSPPEKVGDSSSPPPIIKFFSGMSNTFRVIPMDGSDPARYASAQIPVMFTSNAVQQVRWQQFLDGFALQGAMPDIMNVKYLILPSADYQQQKGQLGDKYQPVFLTPDGGTVVLENRGVLPKAWLVPSVGVVPDSQQRLAVLQNPAFNPRTEAVVETAPPLSMGQPGLLPQQVSIEKYEGERIVVAASTPVNALLVLGEKYYRGWKAVVDGKGAPIQPVDQVLRGVYLTPGRHRVEFFFDPLPFKIGKWLTLASFGIFALLAAREWTARRREKN